MRTSCVLTLPSPTSFSYNSLLLLRVQSRSITCLVLVKWRSSEHSKKKNHLNFPFPQFGVVIYSWINELTSSAVLLLVMILLVVVLELTSLQTYFLSSKPPTSASNRPNSRRDTFVCIRVGPSRSFQTVIIADFQPKGLVFELHETEGQFLIGRRLNDWFLFPERKSLHVSQIHLG